jgi:enediyne biosynthesis protein E4
MLLFFFPVAANGQQKKKPEPSSGMGVATGAAHAAVKDSEHRPITAGGFVDNAPIVFVDATKGAGLDKFHHHSGTPGKATILETMGSGVALLDYDNHGWLDIFLLNGSTIAPLQGTESPLRAMLFHNNHDGTFTDVTDKAAVANERWGFGVAVGDYDNDGWPAGLNLHCIQQTPQQIPDGFSRCPGRAIIPPPRAFRARQGRCSVTLVLSAFLNECSRMSSLA